MHFVCNKNQITSRLKYTIDFIFSTLGINIKMVSSDKFKPKDGMIFGYLNQNELEHFSEENIINIANFNELHNLEKFEKNLSIIQLGGEQIPILGEDLNHGSYKNKIILKKSNVWQFQFDIISNVFYHLSRFEERWRISADENESDWSKSILRYANNLKLPVIDVLLKSLKKEIFLKSKKNNDPIFRILPWPKDEKFAVAFTHDVDLTRGNNAKEFMLSKTKKVFYSILKNETKLNTIQSEFSDKESSVWTFPGLLEFYNKKNWKATFFFIAKIFEGWHLRYNLKSNKFQKLFKNLLKNNHEIALHPSLKAFDNATTYIKEKSVLKKHSSININGMRQHYLRFKTPRIWRLAELAKLKYDSSIGYNFRSGFRAGTSYPFYTFDFNSDERIPVLEIPITCFEYNLSQKDATNEIEILLRQIETYQGIFNFLFHPSNYFISPYKNYWHFLTKKLNRKKAYVETLSNLNKWISNKNKIQFIVKNNNNIMEINFKKPKEVETFAIEMSHNGDFQKNPHVKIEKSSKMKWLVTSKKSNFIIKYKLN